MMQHIDDDQNQAFRNFTASPKVDGHVLEGLETINRGAFPGDPAARKVDGFLNGLLKETLDQPGRSFILEWDGNYDLAGLKLLGHTVGYARDGQMNSMEGRHLGFYKRLISGGGENRQHQKVEIVFAPEVEPR